MLITDGQSQGCNGMGLYTCAAHTLLSSNDGSQEVRRRPLRTLQQSCVKQGQPTVLKGMSGCLLTCEPVTVQAQVFKLP